MLGTLKGTCKVYGRNISSRSPGTHIIGSWVMDSILLYKEPRTGTQYMGNWASRVRIPGLRVPLNPKPLDIRKAGSEQEWLDRAMAEMDGVWISTYRV